MSVGNVRERGIFLEFLISIQLETCWVVNRSQAVCDAPPSFAVKSIAGVSAVRVFTNVSKGKPTGPEKVRERPAPVWGIIVPSMWADPIVSPCLAGWKLMFS